MTWGEILAIVVSCVVTFLVTYLLNWAVDRPKKRREENQKIIDSLSDRIKETKEEITKISDSMNQRFDEQKKTDAMQMRGLQQSLRVSLNSEIEKFMKQGYATMADKESVENLYKAYHALGANGLMDDSMKKFRDLPVSKPTAKKKTTTKTSNEE